MDSRPTFFYLYFVGENPPLFFILSRHLPVMQKLEKTKENNAKGVHAFRRIADEGTREVRFTEDAVA